MTMSIGGAGAFLRQAYLNNWQRYQESLKPETRGGWDAFVLTASDQRQANLYRALLISRQKAGLLPQHTTFVVLPDPPGRHIGSGGATLRALATLSALAAGRSAPPAQIVQPGRIRPLTEARVLIIHSGGESKRLPHCSVTGKLLARIPREVADGRASTVFDEFLISLAGLARDVPPGILVASGDVLLIFDHLQIALQRAGVIGVAASAPAEMAAKHGVYVCESGSYRVQAYLHKPAPDELRRWQGVAADGTVQIDTGLLWFDSAMVGKLLALCDNEHIGRLCGLLPATKQDSGSLHLYADLLLPLAQSTTLAGYLADVSDGPIGAGIHEARTLIWNQLRGTSLSVQSLHPAIFAHFGTSSEYWRLMACDQHLTHLCGWTDQAAGWWGTGKGTLTDGGAAKRYVLINAALEPAAVGALDSQPALVTDSYLGGGLVWRGGALVSGVRTDRPLDLTEDIVLDQAPIAGGGYVTRVFGLHDDPKRSLTDAAATFLNQPWSAWLAETKLAADTLWPGVAPEQRTLWNALLYPLAHDRETSLELVLPLQNAACRTATWAGQWLAAQRLSLAECADMADGWAILEHIWQIEDYVGAARFLDAVQREQPAATAGRLLAGHDDQRGRVGLVQQRLAGADAILQLRGYAALAMATGDAWWEDCAFNTLSSLIRNGAVATPRRYDAPATHTPDRKIRVEAAARLDFGGGWTDTPPYSIERGGTVLNAAITLHGKYPIVVEAESLLEPRLVLQCRDIDASFEPTSIGDVLNYANPADPFALLKAACVLRGLVEPSAAPHTPLADGLRVRSGLRISTQTSIPRGSGLGTSSILAGAVLFALARCQNASITDDALFDEVLCLEQMLTTGGGWQDQVGGLTGGIKLVTSKPGLPQHLSVEPLPLPSHVKANMDERLLLVYTGQQRLAKNLLRHVMGRWMVRDPEMVWILGRIAELAIAMQRALYDGDLDGFGELLTEHWLLNKRMDAGCTNAFINDLFEFMTPYMCGAKLAGAGGGGFAIVVARDVERARQLADDLRLRYAGTPVAVWPCGIPDAGVRVVAPAAASKRGGYKAG